MLTQPVGQATVVEATCGQIEHDVFLHIGGASISLPLRTKKVSMAACPTRLFPSTKGWL